MCLSVFHIISQNNAARITKLDIETFYHESWKPIYYGIKRSSVKVTMLGSWHPCECWLFLSFLVFLTLNLFC